MPYALPYFLLIKLSCCLQGVIFWYISTSSIWCTTASEAMKMVAWLVPGVPLTNAFRNFTENDYLSGLSRLIDTLLTAGALAVGVGIAIGLAMRLGLLV